MIAYVSGLGIVSHPKFIVNQPKSARTRAIGFGGCASCAAARARIGWEKRKSASRKLVTTEEINVEVNKLLGRQSIPGVGKHFVCKGFQ